MFFHALVTCVIGSCLPYFVFAYPSDGNSHGGTVRSRALAHINPETTIIRDGKATFPFSVPLNVSGASHDESIQDPFGPNDDQPWVGIRPSLNHLLPFGPFGAPG